MIKSRPLLYLIIFSGICITSILHTASEKAEEKNKSDIPPKNESTPQLPLSFEETKKILDSVYKNNEKGGYNIPKEEASMIGTNGGNSTYGEISFDGLNQLIQDLKLTKDDVFYDLGSGVGKPSLQVALSTPARAVGVELSPTRHDQALQFKKKAEEITGIQFGNKLDYRKENITKTDISDATVILMCSTCYSDELMKHIADLLVTAPRNLRILSLRTLPEGTPLGAPLKTYTIAMSWSATTPVHYYEFKKDSTVKKQEAPQEKMGTHAHTTAKEKEPCPVCSGQNEFVRRGKLIEQGKPY